MREEGIVDVLFEVSGLLRFESEDDFYFLQILQRKKENELLGSNSRVIKNYYIGSVEYLEDKYDEIKSLCQEFNARAMLRLNKRSYSKVSFKVLQNIANCMSNGDYRNIKSQYDRACGQTHNDTDKTWIVDIDGDISDNEVLDMFTIINNSRPEGPKVITVLPTKDGKHIITRPFEMKQFKEVYPDIDIHKDNPINLYIPKFNKYQFK